MMSAFMAIFGALALYSAFTGKGPAFKNDYPKAMKEDADKLTRLFCWIFGPIALVTGVLDFMGHQWAFWASFVVIIPGFVIYIIIFRKRFKKYLDKK